MNVDHPNYQADVQVHADRYRADESDTEALNFLRKARHAMALACLKTQSGNITQPPADLLGRAYEAIMTCGMRNAPLTPEERQFAEKLAESLRNGLGRVGGYNSLLACMLYLDGYQTDIRINHFQIPPWALPYLSIFLFDRSKWMCSSEEFERFNKLCADSYRALHATLFDPGKNERERAVFLQEICLPLLSKKISLVPLYFDDRSMREECTLRAEILEYAAKVMGYPTEHVFVPRDPRRKIRVGILRSHFGESAETFATLPVFEHLDPERFEVLLYTTGKERGDPVEKHCVSRAVRSTKLAAPVSNPVSVVRSDDLDILFLGTNLTASLTSSMLALHRLARVQIASFCEPATSGIRNIDYYVAGELALPANNPEQFYTERLATIPGSGICFSYGGVPPTSLPMQRADLGIPDDVVMYISGANMHKIGRPLCESWAAILSEVPESRLVLYPFNPNWTEAYPTEVFVRELHAIFAQHGIERKRVIILQPRRDFAEIRGILSLANVYLDGYPYAGATSIADALQSYLPAVVLEGRFLRFRQAAAMIREMALPELVATNEEEYRRIAIELGLHGAQREKFRRSIRENLGKKGNFLDAKGYSEAIGELFTDLIHKQDQ